MFEVIMLANNRLSLIQVGFCTLTLTGGAVLHLLDLRDVASWLWLSGACVVLVAVLADTIAALWRKKLGLDLIALVSIVGALALQENLAAAVIALMFASGRALEGYAEKRARDDMSALLSKAPRLANRYENGVVVQVPLTAVQPGDRLLVRPGETVPVDGTLMNGATVDESSLTGEALPVPYPPGVALGSGVINAGNAFDLLATSTADNSTFATIIRLVESARASKAPAARLADRYALLFVPLALGIAGIAWLLTGDPNRALAVVVVATPCPLILAVPVAIVSAMSRCARRGVLIKHGGALEKMAQVDTIFFDKTGTLTGGKARLVAVATDPSAQPEDVLRLAASLEQMSSHAIAQAVVGAAVERRLVLSTPRQVIEQPGAGLSGHVDGKEVRVGGYDYVSGTAEKPAWSTAPLERIGYDGAAGVCIAIDGKLHGVLEMADEIRLDSPRALRLLRACGVRRIAMLTGDRRDVAHTIACSLGIDAVMPEQTPSSKLAEIAKARMDGVTMMVGDGINDAPALAAADIGVAMGARGAAAAAESAQVVLLVDRLDRLAFAVRIAQQTRTIALQSVIGGMTLSMIAMLVAAYGYLPPVAGALLQELIDVAVILNALRVLRLDVATSEDGMPPGEVARLKEEHARLLPIIERLGSLADRADTMPSSVIREELVALNTLLRSQLLPHESDDDARLYPHVARLIGGEDSMASMSNTHREIFRLSRIVDRFANVKSSDGDPGASMLELRRTLYALDAILRLHFSQEEEIYHSLSS
ncbi:heavy metal translocating P-type ATPase [Massilia niastensis]|uniref:heavy metal translocating P-type ATPase n=1 Tax=Massilia niastensis TaxID=544911 RepID=UPI00037D55DE|nr:heavy metal translocating P-type ATPase [Massilia niastensis]